MDAGASFVGYDTSRLESVAAVAAVSLLTFVVARLSIITAFVTKIMVCSQLRNRQLYF